MFLISSNWCLDVYKMEKYYDLAEIIGLKWWIQLAFDICCASYESSFFLYNIYSACRNYYFCILPPNKVEFLEIKTDISQFVKLKNTVPKMLERIRKNYRILLPDYEL